MDDREYREVYEALNAVLKKHHLDWISQQVSDEIARGKNVREKKVRRSRAVPALQVREASGRNEPFLTSDDYTPKERLALLINAVEQVFVHNVEMQQLIMKSLGRHGTRIAFRSEDSEEPTTILSANTSVDRNLFAVDMKGLLAGLRKIVEGE